MATDNHDKHENGNGGHHHYILPDSTAHKTFGALLVLTLITVGLSYVHLGSMNYVVGMIVAFIKATLVAAIFMNLRKDDKANTVIFLSSLVFLAIFIVLTSTDILFRGGVYTNGPIFKPVSGPSKYKKAWETSPELVAHGKEVFAQQCVSCHGVMGKGDGPAAGALNPRPRNFTADADWKNGRKPSQIFKTLKEGIAGGGMASFVTLPSDDRWALTHYVATLGPNVLTDDASDLTKIGIDPNKEGGGAVEEKTIPVEVAMKQLVKEAGQEGSTQNVDPNANEGLEHYNKRLNTKSFSNK
jgi:caa(3)-type oxidase subunit IV